VGASRIFGGGNDDQLSGGANNDTLRGDGGNDTLTGGSGNDILDSDSSNSAGDDLLVGGIGNDSLYALGADTIRGDAGNDFIQVWSDQAYDIQGGDDSDTVSIVSNSWFIGSSFSLAGNRIEFIQANGQEIYGGANFSAVTDDLLDFTGITVTNLDFVSGQGGNDTIRGLAGSSRLLGAAGNDWIEGGAGNDTLRGDGGNDTLIGGNGNDVLDGDTSNGSGDDSLVGGSGNDTLFASGADTIRGDAGNDLILVSTDRAYDIQGGADSDTVSIVSNWWFIGSSFSRAGNGIDNIQANGQEIYGGSSFSSTSNDTIDLSDLTVVGLDFLDAQGGDDFVTGSLANDDLRGGEGNDTLIGGGGNDTLRGGNGTDVFDGGTGIDTLDFSFAGTGGSITLPTGVSTIGGLNESFTSIENVIGSSNVDNITGSDADNFLDGGFGNDAIRGGLGNDTISGGFGTNDLRGDGGVDTVDFRFLGPFNDATINLATGVSTFSSGSSAIVEFENAVGGAGNDSITGTGAANLLDGLLGSDTILAGGGNDTLIGGLGADDLNGEGGIDLVDYSYALGGTINLTAGTADFGPADIDSLTSIEDVLGSQGRDTIIGTALSNRLDGGRSNDSIRGEAGDDILIGGLGADSLEGGLGSDTLIGGTGNDTLIGGDNSDLYDIDSAGDLVIETNAILATGGTDRVVSSLASYTLTANVENLTLGVGGLNGTGNALNNAITGNAAANVLNGAGGADTLTGGEGNDNYSVDNAGDLVNESNADPVTGGIDRVVSSLASYILTANVENLTLGDGGLNGTGNTLNNAITGNSATNVLNGAGGNDTLAGGVGNDTLTGGIGADTFRFGSSPNATTNRDVITDFVVLQGDLIELENSVFTTLTTTGTLAASAFTTGVSATAASHRILYDGATGLLAFDSDGTGGAAAIAFATLMPGLGLSNTSFTVT
jgi:Ca2+-binding RTX toxin-like protein